MRYYLPISDIDKIDQCIVNIVKVHLHPYFIFHLKYFNIIKSVLYIEQFSIG